MNLSLRRALVALSVAAGVTTCGLAPAGAHPFGDPQTLEISVRGSQVTAVWQAAADDYTSLGLRLGAVEGPRRMVYEDGALTPATVDGGDVTKLASSPALEDYLLSTIQVTQDGQECPGRLRTAAALAETGAMLVFSCAEEVDGVEVAAVPLLDLHPAYRTMATGPGGATYVFSADSSSHTFTRDAAGATLARSGMTLAATTSTGVVLAGGWLALRRRRARRARPA